ncbi:SGNH/GDSL hydrolase family protein [Clostridium sp. SHJSY1]|uniref:SGNH/GDSL hydrolase family protein n=1 Tax=Clostridium sp. SHJSY1 TaxID=2942483 RepID=UPI00287520A1|nr:SGNH/GDSL hydrolase family protein [Clostridium sp. SHJSY1]MDS0526685.1 SGNH/GDSL hydrolase family protein [Clostridium sp. SHJSY1]
MNNSKKGLIIIIALTFVFIGVLTMGIIKDRNLNTALAESSTKKVQEEPKEETKTEEKAPEEKKEEVKNTETLDFYGKLKEKQSVRILILGDGLAMSQGRTSENGIWDKGVANLIQTTYGSKVELKSLAQGGASTAVGIDIVKANDIKDYDLVITCFGHNDNNTSVNTNQMKTNYNNIIAEVKNKSPKATIIVVLPSTLALDNTYRDNIQKVATENNVAVADMKKAFTESGVKESTLMNGALPNDKGYQVYTQTIGNVIKVGIK